MLQKRRVAAVLGTLSLRCVKLSTYTKPLVVVAHCGGASAPLPSFFFPFLTTTQGQHFGCNLHPYPRALCFFVDILLDPAGYRLAPISKYAKQESTPTHCRLVLGCGFTGLLRMQMGWLVEKDVCVCVRPLQIK
ncbi:hypothetical protein C8F01DRAFT_790590 [Mycena amicta]|nr:hypothetical protein C8F01DRAFT_790590 [Mycena amicta]